MNQRAYKCLNQAPEAEEYKIPVSTPAIMRPGDKSAKETVPPVRLTYRVAESRCRCCAARTATAIPDRKVGPPTVAIAHATPKRSATIPERSAPTAYPRSRQRR